MGETILKTAGRIALSISALLLLTSCSVAGPTTTEPGATSTSQETPAAQEQPVALPHKQTVATKAVIGDDGYSLSKSVYGGSLNGECVIGVDETLVCATRKPSLSPKLNDRILALDYWNRSYDGDAGTTKIEGISGRDIIINRVLATPRGYLFLIEPSGKQQLIHADTKGLMLWKKDLGEEPYDIGVSDTEVLVVDSTGTDSFKLDDGSTGTTKAKPGIVLAGTTPSRDGYSSFAPGTIGLAKADGGSVLTPADIPALSDSCLSTPVPGCEADAVQYADGDYVVTQRSIGELDTTRAYTADGALAWQIKGNTTSVVRFGDVFAVGYPGNEFENSSGKLSVIAAHDGSVLTETSKIEHGSVFAAGITDKGVIVGFDGPGVPGAWEVIYDVLELTVTTEEIEVAPTAAETASSVKKNGKPTVSTGGAFAFDLPTGWTSSGELNEDMGSTTKLVSANGKAVVQVMEGINGIGGGTGGDAGCEKPLVEELVWEYPLQGINTASAAYGLGAPTLKMPVDYFGRHSYEINTMRANCSADHGLMHAGPAGASWISAESTAEFDSEAEGPSAEATKLHQEILAVLMSTRFASEK